MLAPFLLHVLCWISLVINVWYAFHLPDDCAQWVDVSLGLAAGVNLVLLKRTWNILSPLASLFRR
ncbi:zinc transporter ZupT [Pseudomonas nitritireducens]|uniref:Zinc transporter ZupT n=1 Tax=Pseudomonas nitroreducens TaxID=46680 RepID=A0A7W7KET9_PSENT|nr:hypothetical protein [Pseudomonas nitritireducens]MBB4861494.1 zinc transporter ZupT [Pseudomonas nitritireducens]